MPVKVRCSSCEKVFAVPDAARGKAVKCPKCESRVAVPAGDSEQKQTAAKSSGDKAKKKPAAAAAKPADSEDFLQTLDLRRAEDTNARICSKCGYDMSELDEEETECPKCGFDIAAGGLGVKARKKQMKGPDPADFYPGLVKNSWKFVLKNQLLAWRTDVYTLVCLLISMGCAFMYLWISAWPPRAFFGLCFFVAFLVIPGWLWYLDTEVIKLTLERKDKFKKLNFDFFLASAKGVMFVAWLVAVAAPILAIPALVGYYLVHYSGQPEWMLGVCIGIGSIPVLWMLPVVMSHMTMPIPTPGWMFWKVVTFAFRTFGGLTFWLLWLVISNIPIIGGAAVIGAVWGNDIGNIVRTMESNADINRQITAAENAPKGGKKAAAPVDPATIGKPADVDFKPLIGPAIILCVMCLPVGFIAMFNMRINGQFTYYFKERMELQDKAKEYKYVAKERRGDDDEDAPRTTQKDLVDGIVFGTLFVLLGGIGGMLYGSFSNAGMLSGVLFGILGASALGNSVTGIMLIVAGFSESVGWGLIVWFVPFGVFVFIAKHWEKTRKLLFQGVFTGVFYFGSLVTLVAMGLMPSQQAQPDANPQPAGNPPGQMMQMMPPGQMQPGQMQPGQMQSGQMMQPGQMQPGGATPPGGTQGAPAPGR